MSTHDVAIIIYLCNIVEKKNYRVKKKETNESGYFHIRHLFVGRPIR